MRHSPTVVSLGLAALAAGTGVCWAQPYHGTATVFPKVDLIVPLPPGPGRRLEHSPVRIPFSLAIHPGVGGAKPTLNLAVCHENSQNCVEFPNVTAPWNSPNGAALTVDAPAAGEKVKVRLVACIATRDANQVLGCGRILADDDTEFSTFMRIMVRLDNFRVLQTRARSRDTIFTALGGTLQDQPAPTINQCSLLGGFNVDRVPCAGPQRFGNVGGGKHALTRMTIGPFDLVPGRERHLTFAYNVLNYGHPVLPLGGPVIDMPPNVTRLMLSGLKRTPVDRDMTPEFNALNGWRGCDGPTAAETVRLYNHRGPGHASIDDITKATGRFVSSPLRTFVVPGQTLCRTSRYQVQWSLERTSWRRP